jgi:hypothetical protein
MTPAAYAIIGIVVTFGLLTWYAVTHKEKK